MKALRIACVALVLILALPMASCGDNAPELEEVKENFIYLIEESRELNHIFFGMGLPVYRRDDAITDRKMVYFIDDLTGYDRIMEQSKYVSIDEIKAAAEQVYSKDYLSEVYEGAFDGIMTGETSAYVRFYDDGEYLYQHMDLYDFTVNERIYDYSTMRVVEPYSSTYVNIVIESYTLDNPKRQEIDLSFVFENGNWYLDSPTY